MQEAHAQLPKQIKKIYSRPKNQLFSSLRLSTSDIARKLHTNCPLAGGSVWAKKYTNIFIDIGNILTDIERIFIDIENILIDIEKEILCQTKKKLLWQKNRQGDRH